MAIITSDHISIWSSKQAIGLFSSSEPAWWIRDFPFGAAHFPSKNSFHTTIFKKVLMVATLR